MQKAGKKCVFCPKLVTKKEQHKMLNRALFLKYSNSYDHLQLKEIEEFVQPKRKVHIINFKDNVLYEQEEDYMTECFSFKQIYKKIQFLTEYYKYHNEIPRFFMKKISDVMNRYHDKKRRIDYYRIKKLLKEQNEDVEFSQEESESSSDSDSGKKKRNLQDIKICSKILKTFMEEVQKSLMKKKIEKSQTLDEINSYLLNLQHESWNDISVSMVKQNVNFEVEQKKINQFQNLEYNLAETQNNRSIVNIGQPKKMIQMKECGNYRCSSPKFLSLNTAQTANSPTNPIYKINNQKQMMNVKMMKTKP